jgi:hypothetical protein
MNKQWIYRNGDKPFSVTEIKMPNGSTQYTSVTKEGGMRWHSNDGEGFDHKHDLIPYEPYADFKIDDEVHCWNDENGIVTSAHFSGLNSKGRPTTFTMGGTSFTRHSLQVNAWIFCEKADREDK